MVPAFRAKGSGIVVLQYARGLRLFFKLLVTLIPEPCRCHHTSRKKQHLKETIPKESELVVPWRVRNLASR